MLLDVAVKVDGVSFGEGHDCLFVGGCAAGDDTSFGVAVPLFRGCDEGVDLDYFDVVELLDSPFDEGLVSGLLDDEAETVVGLFGDVVHLLGHEGFDDDTDGIGL